MDEQKKVKLHILKEKITKFLWFFANPRLLLCVGLAWIVTNGWSYMLMGIGIVWDIAWMQAVAGAYLAFLWFPFTPEKIVTLIIAIFLLRWLFPKDEKTLGILRNMMQKLKEKKKKRQD
ncbi:MAG: hypothetical protein J6Q92_02175 [Oscillospiraceae bacterium]|nr:hypothetical protein [Oscillospiraceae bacterium]